MCLNSLCCSFPAGGDAESTYFCRALEVVLCALPVVEFFLMQYLGTRQSRRSRNRPPIQSISLRRICSCNCLNSVCCSFLAGGEYAESKPDNVPLFYTVKDYQLSLSVSRGGVDGVTAANR
eukprot:TRINITY_DN2153_c0_g2_i2.p1 TRINITY_DN2153_c0_g2~~TRINITY_DN2153_c0_g2_i2.p1  ORF type:complete len:121 (-),score=4.72 TRINITY_DN2153_c0_g2_i2:345-707(-)